MNSSPKEINLTQEEIDSLVFSVEEAETLNIVSDKTLRKLPLLSDHNKIKLYEILRDNGKRHEITWRNEFITLTEIENDKLPVRYFLDLKWFLGEVAKDEDQEDSINSLVDFLLSDEVKESLEELKAKIKESGQLYLLKAIEEYKKETAEKKQLDS